MAKTIVYVLDIIVFCISITLLVIDVIQFRKDVNAPFMFNYLNKVYYNWRRSPIQEANDADQTIGYQVLKLGQYEGSVKGCKCMSSEGIYEYTRDELCSEDQKANKCVDVAEQPSTEYEFTMKLLYYFKLTEYSYYSYLQNATTGECGEDQKQCGILDTAGNKMCISNNPSIVCPVNSYRVNSFYNDSINQTIMLMFNASIGNPCLHSGYTNFQGNKFDLALNPDKIGCPKVYGDISEDTRFKVIATQLAPSFYRGCDLQELSDFEDVNNHGTNIMQFYSIHYIGLNVECYKKFKKDFDDGIFNNTKLPQTLYYYKMSRNLEMVLILFFSFMVFLGVVHWIITIKKKYRLMNKLENQIWTMIVLLSFFSVFIIVSFYLSSPIYTIHYDCFIEEYEQEALKQADEALKLWKKLDMSMIILCIFSGLISFCRDFLTKDDIIQADYLQYNKSKDENELDSSSFYEERNSSVASIEIDNPTQGSLNQGDNDMAIHD